MNIDKCSICQDELKQTDRIRRLQCHHIFHQDCIDKWIELRNLCPLCQSVADETQPVKELFDKKEDDDLTLELIAHLNQQNNGLFDYFDEFNSFGAFGILDDIRNLGPNVSVFTLSLGSDDLFNGALGAMPHVDAAIYSLLSTNHRPQQPARDPRPRRQTQQTQQTQPMNHELQNVNPIGARPGRAVPPPVQPSVQPSVGGFPLQSSSSSSSGEFPHQSSSSSGGFPHQSSGSGSFASSGRSQLRSFTGRQPSPLAQPDRFIGQPSSAAVPTNPVVQVGPGRQQAQQRYPNLVSEQRPSRRMNDLNDNHAAHQHADCPEQAQCANCFNISCVHVIKRCSRCKQIRYCSKKCQIAHYDNHKNWCVDHRYAMS